MMYVRGVYKSSICLRWSERETGEREIYIYIVVWCDVSCCTMQRGVIGILFVCLLAELFPRCRRLIYIFSLFFGGDTVGEKGIKGDGVSVVSVFWFLSCLVLSCIFSSFKNTQLGKLLYRSMVSVNSVCMYIYMRTMLQFSN